MKMCIRDRCYRMSISWTRIFPKGDEEKPNEEGLLFYENVFKELLKYNIEPIVTCLLYTSHSRCIEELRKDIAEYPCCFHYHPAERKKIVSVKLFVYDYKTDTHDSCLKSEC